MDDFERASEVIREDFAEQAKDQRIGDLTPITCPDCGGALWQTDEGGVLRFRCHVGHAYAGEVLLGQKSEEVEAALWASVRLLKERAALSRQVAHRLRSGGEQERADKIEEQAMRDENHVQSIRGLLALTANPIAARVSGAGVFGDDQ